MDAGLLVDLAHASLDEAAFERALLPRLMTFVGADVGAFRVGLGPLRSVEGVESGLLGDERIRARHAAELESVLSAAHRDGIAVDVRVLGERRVRGARYFSEIVRPRGGRETLFALPALRGQPTACLLLGRCGAPGRFPDRDLHRLGALLPALAIASAAIARQRSANTSLTIREREIVDYLALGFRSREIAAALGTSVNTVRNQVARLMARLGAGTRAELVVLCRARQNR